MRISPYFPIAVEEDNSRKFTFRNNVVNAGFGNMITIKGMPGLCTKSELEINITHPRNLLFPVYDSKSYNNLFSIELMSVLYNQRRGVLGVVKGIILSNLESLITATSSPEYKRQIIRELSLIKDEDYTLVIGMSENFDEVDPELAALFPKKHLTYEVFNELYYYNLYERIYECPNRLVRGMPEELHESPEAIILREKNVALSLKEAESEVREKRRAHNSLLNAGFESTILVKGPWEFTSKMCLENFLYYRESLDNLFEVYDSRSYIAESNWKFSFSFLDYNDNYTKDESWRGKARGVILTQLECLITNETSPVMKDLILKKFNYAQNNDNFLVIGISEHIDQVDPDLVACFAERKEGYGFFDRIEIYNQEDCCKRRLEKMNTVLHTSTYEIDTSLEWDVTTPIEPFLSWDSDGDPRYN
ncbi:hypothetical protein DASB73_009610 [Starmerella bacillaris]|uniref:Uncharacterized protein n=1 Tax=Starmerella bacillaris TaxID=1247836 RepID=A0AAV5RFY0_STABA|nr:hypothetical protein DASB73_009610 [Starmerella bacillaris]